MESFYRTYRPQKFEEVVGQTAVVDTLTKAIENNKLSHAYLFCGPRGTGKTTMARLVAKSFVCDAGTAALPDGACEECVAVATGTHPDILELDAASRTGVDAIREEIVNRVEFAPARARAKVYIIDEVHMLTTQAFNALLKTLEEPPAHVYFILCTTDPQKIPETILSRVQRFDFHAISDSDIAQHLTRIAEQEHITLEPEATDLIVSHVHGGLRDALGALEQLSVFGNGSVSAESARLLFGQETNDAIIAIVEALIQKNVQTIFAILDGIINEGKDLRLFTRNLLKALRDVYVVKFAGAQASLMMLSSEDASRFTDINPGLLVDALKKLDEVSLQMRDSENPRLDVELAFVTLLAQPDTAAQPLEVQPQQNQPKMASLEKTPKVALTKPIKQVQADATVKPKPAATKTPAQPKPAQEQKPDVPSAQEKVEASPKASDKPSPHERNWSLIKEELKLHAPAVLSLLLQAELTDDTGAELTIHVTNASDFVKTMLAKEENLEPLRAAVKQIVGERKLVITGLDATSPQVQQKDQQTATKPQARPNNDTRDAKSEASQDNEQKLKENSSQDEKQDVAKNAAESQSKKKEMSQEDITSMMQDIFGDNISITKEPKPGEAV